MTEVPILREEKVPLKSRIWVSIADASCAMLNTFVVSIGLTYYFTSFRGLEAGLATTAWLIFAIWNAVNDPLFGYLSDRTKSGLGRRIPYIRYGAPVIGLAFVLIWVNFGGMQASQTVMFIQMVLLLFVFDTLYTAIATSIYVMPFEMAVSNKARSGIFIWKLIFSVFPLVVPLVLWGFIKPEPGSNPILFQLIMAAFGLVMALLIFFSTFNNFLGGVFMGLMDAYGLSLVSVEVWGVLWAILSCGFIVGGLFIAKFGLGKNPLFAMFAANIIIWVISSVFTIQPSIVLLSIGMFVYISVVPFIEAAEHTIIQKVVPLERQGRVFGFAQSLEMSAAPLTTFLIGPVTELFFIPFMTTGVGVDLIGGWFGTGAARGIALVFTLTGVIGLIVTLVAMNTKYYGLLSKRYTTNPEVLPEGEFALTRKLATFPKLPRPPNAPCRVLVSPPWNN